ncbi:hypothetical protein XU18_5184 [Perkinsela sp. CCAP 1560/4]|nr:hypothetical protein XU18_5184 [Perkinsela sp. CCAP 1560/4]|eukprot:KNH01395.1 hypothetical protein XU18_5184 [Perkinsela sp. CCAP 1560/4]
MRLHYSLDLSNKRRFPEPSHGWVLVLTHNEEVAFHRVSGQSIGAHIEMSDAARELLKTKSASPMLVSLSPAKLRNFSVCITGNAFPLGYISGIISTSTYFRRMLQPEYEKSH